MPAPAVVDCVGCRMVRPLNAESASRGLGTGRGDRAQPLSGTPRAAGDLGINPRGPSRGSRVGDPQLQQQVKRARPERSSGLSNSSDSPLRAASTGWSRRQSRDWSRANQPNGRKRSAMHRLSSAEECRRRWCQPWLVITDATAPDSARVCRDMRTEARGSLEEISIRTRPRQRCESDVFLNRPRRDQLAARDI